MKELSIENISRIFQIFGERECKEVSPLYYQLSKEISQDEDLLKLAKNCKERQPIPNLFYGSIHYLLLKNQAEELAEYYPSISKKKIKNIPVRLIKEFCERRESEIVELLKNRIVQTNAINRTAYLMPIISSVFKFKENVNLIDIGTSSGLTLNYDKYEYNYEGDSCFGESKVKIRSKLAGGKLPLFEELIKAKIKIGIDQNPLDLTKKDNSLWLKSLIWPDLKERFERMESAIELVKDSNLELYQANRINDFRKIISKIPVEEELLIYHTHVLYQFTKEERKSFRAMLDEIKEERNYKYLAVESNQVFDREDYKGNGISIVLTEYGGGKKQTRIMGETDGHANWINWK